jgi:cell division protein FtsA
VNNKIVAFDIGTRSVVGIIIEHTNEGYRVLDLVTIEHNERSMLDGQIHDILSVTETIIKVKNILEERHGKIRKVCVAAAGRALKTKQSIAKKDIKNQPLLANNDIFHLELSAVQQAQFSLAHESTEKQSTNYYCTGYSVLQYRLDGDEIGSLIDQQGDMAEVEIIATFLPKIVVESLISALQRAGLEMDALTLEPIAAINVLIPSSMRRLNVALVDIGAGTSDIAITNFGTVIGYGMVPIAGDEITDAISNHYLLDFPLAENVKREITMNQQAKIIDILGFESEVTYDEVANNIEASINHLADGICEEIIRLNKKAPQAVMLVGGGSLTPNIGKTIAHKLKLPENRVAIRGTNAIQGLQPSDALPEGPAFVTPVGIAIAAKQSPVHYISVSVNNQSIRLFDLKQLTIGDSLLAAGIEVKKLYGKPGIAKIVQLNGKNITIPGTLGNPPVIEKNGEPTHLKDSLKHGDHIIVKPGENGDTPSLTLHDLVDDVFSLTVFINEEKYHLEPYILINGEPKDFQTQVKDGDKIQITPIQTVKELLTRLNHESYLSTISPYKLTLNEQTVELKESKQTLYVNNKIATEDTLIRDQDKLTITNSKELTLGDIINELKLDMYEELPIYFDSKKINLKKLKKAVYRDKQQLKTEDIIYNQDTLFISELDPEPFIFQDIFRYVDFDLSNLKGRQFKLFVNGNEAAFTTTLAPNDEVSIRWIESIFTKKS